MAPTPEYLSPVQQLGELGVKARKRGLTFEEFWNEAVRPDARGVVMTTTPNAPATAVRWPSNTKQREEWLEVVLDGKETWRSAYEGVSSSSEELALRTVRDMRESLEERDVGALVAA